MGHISSFCCLGGSTQPDELFNPILNGGKGGIFIFNNFRFSNGVAILELAEESHKCQKDNYVDGLSMSPAYSSILRIAMPKTISFISLPMPIKSNSFFSRISVAAF